MTRGINQSKYEHSSSRVSTKVKTYGRPPTIKLLIDTICLGKATWLQLLINTTCLGKAPCLQPLQIFKYCSAKKSMSPTLIQSSNLIHAKEHVIISHTILQSFMPMSMSSTLIQSSNLIHAKEHVSYNLNIQSFIQAPPLQNATSWQGPCEENGQII